MGNRLSTVLLMATGTYSYGTVRTLVLDGNRYYARFAFMADDVPYAKAEQPGRMTRRLLSAMVAFADEVMGNITGALKRRGMWDNTLVCLQSDNGGLAFTGSNHVGNNWPLRGSKMHDWEGGVRVNGFVAGGFIATHAPHMAGQVLNGLFHTADFYATFCALAGQDPFDYEAHVVGQ